MTSVVDASSSQPWVEKYRPSTFDDIVLEDINKQMLKNIVEHNSFPICCYMDLWYRKNYYHYQFGQAVSREISSNK